MIDFLMTYHFLSSASYHFPVVIPSLNKLLLKMGYPLSTMPKDAEDFFYEITKQALEMRSADVDKVIFLTLSIRHYNYH